MKPTGEIKAVAIRDGHLPGMTFEFPDGRTISVIVHSFEPDYITIMAEDRITVTPWATNMVRIKFGD